MTPETFRRAFAQGLEALAGLSLGAARPRYDRLCQSFAPPLPEGMTVADTSVAGVATRRLRPWSALSTPGDRPVPRSAIGVPRDSGTGPCMPMPPSPPCERPGGTSAPPWPIGWREDWPDD